MFDKDKRGDFQDRTQQCYDVRHCNQHYLTPVSLSPLQDTVHEVSETSHLVYHQKTKLQYVHIMSQQQADFQIQLAATQTHLFNRTHNMYFLPVVSLGSGLPCQSTGVRK